MGEFFDKNRSLIFKKYPDDELVKDVLSYKNGSGNLNKTLNNFFEELIFESCGRGSSISPMQVLLDDNKLEEIFAYIKTKPKFYTADDIANLKSYFRNAVSWVRKVANFPAKTARDIYFRYNDVNGERISVLDTSAGFGSRMSAALISGHNYCGIDPNKQLCNKLKEYHSFLTRNGIVDTSQRFGLYCKGSEIEISDLKNKFDVSFTSPPYFNLEKYSDDDFESTKNYGNYSLWVERFVKPTVLNTYSYLKCNGYAMINIKNLSKKLPLYDDFFAAFSLVDGFEYVETFDMTIAKKQYGLRGTGDIENKEPVMVFRKKS